jgi:hypothetical protein
MSSSALAIVSAGGDINIQRVKDQRDAIQQLLRDVLKEGIDNDYAVIPGTKKKTLLKPGAEKICSLFGIAVEPIVDASRIGDDYSYRVTVRLSSGGVFLGEGVGEASTLESKFAWRAAVCAEEWDEAETFRRRKHWQRGYQGGNPTMVLQVRENPADKANNMLKMAKKRSLIDAVLTATAASDVFTQDLEPLIDRSTGKSTAPVSGRQVENARAVDIITPEEGKAFFKAWKVNGKREVEQVKQYMKVHCGGITDDRKMERQYYAEALRWAGTNEPIPEVKKREPEAAKAQPATIDAKMTTKTEPDPVMENIKTAFHLLDYDLIKQAELFGEYRGRLPELAEELKARVTAELPED